MSAAVNRRLSQLLFHLKGCVTSIGLDKWDLQGALTRTSAGCPNCEPATIGRHYTLVRAAQGSQVNYTYTADEPPRGCGVGIDLLQVVLHE